MIRFLVGALALGISCTAAAANALHFNPTQPVLARNMQTFGVTSMPVGYYEYCLRYTDRCKRELEGTSVQLTKTRWREIVSVNADVNATVAPLTDIEIYGVEESWEYPTAVGDCEDYALLKRKRLNEMGYPLGALLMTVARDSNGGGHAVLTVVTDLGDFILDNLRGEIRNWSETEYTYLKRQDSRNPGKWVKIRDGRDTTAVSGIR